MLKTIAYANEQLTILDQTLLPVKVAYTNLETTQQVFDAIARLQVRGAPLIGVTAAYGVLVGVRDFKTSQNIVQKVQDVCEHLRAARPTAVNLSWALDRMLAVAQSAEEAALVYPLLCDEAQRIHDEDTQINKRIGQHTYDVIEGLITNNTVSILTHCNAGGLATTGYGTATSVMYLLKELGVNVQVYACETRPLLQGARLTAFELSEAGVDTTLITDNMVASVMAQGLIDFAIVGADRVAANHDVANKIGTLGISVLARHYNVPFYVACPSPTFDKYTRCGADIIIEKRDGSEITTLAGTTLAPVGINTYNPSFDVTPACNITGIITENGLLRSSHGHE